MIEMDQELLICWIHILVIVWHKLETDIRDKYQSEKRQAETNGLLLESICFGLKRFCMKEG